MKVSEKPNVKEQVLNYHLRTCNLRCVEVHCETGQLRSNLKVSIGIVHCGCKYKSLTRRVCRWMRQYFAGLVWFHMIYDISKSLFLSLWVWQHNSGGLQVSGTIIPDMPAVKCHLTALIFFCTMWNGFTPWTSVVRSVPLPIAEQWIQNKGR